MRKIIGYVCISIAVLLVLAVLYMHSSFYNATRTFSSYTILSSSWDMYKTQFINKDGRVIDSTQGDITTSEGQSYALLRSVWIDDKETFDLVWKWTKSTMKRPSDNLFGWRWGKKGDNTYGFIANGGDNAATDADADIALALILAGHRWHNDMYISDAKSILPDLWTKETALLGGKRYLIAGNWANRSQDIVINPSYFAPYAWRIFAREDKKHDWNSLIQPAYTLLSDAGTAPLDASKGIGLPPDWLSIDKKTQAIKAVPSPDSNLTTHYGYDAVRIPWRIAIDYAWNNEPLAKQYLQTAFTVLLQDYKNKGVLGSVYAHDGSVIESTEDPAMYATSIGFLSITDQDLAKKMYEEKIIKLYSNDKNTFNSNIPYYEQNWLWFGVGLYNKYIIPYT